MTQSLDLIQIINESVDIIDINEDALEGFEYEIPQDKEKLLYDFYMSTVLNPPHELPKDAKINADDYRNLMFTINYSKKKLYDFLKKEMLNAVFFSLSAEIRHIFDADTWTNVKNLLTTQEREIFEKWVKNWSAVTHFGVKPRVELDQQVRDLLKKTKSNNKEYYNSFKAALKADPSRTEMVKIYQKLFSTANWRSSYGGPAWANIAKAWLRLNDTSIKDVNDEKGMKEVMVWIDHVYDLQHNTDTVFNKISDYTKNGSYTWLKKALDYKRDVKNPYGMFDKISHSMKELASRSFYAWSSAEKGDGSYEEYLKSMGSKNVDSKSKTENRAGGSKVFEIGDVVVPKYGSNKHDLAVELGVGDSDVDQMDRYGSTIIQADSSKVNPIFDFEVRINGGNKNEWWIISKFFELKTKKKESSDDSDDDFMLDPSNFKDNEVVNHYPYKGVYKKGEDVKLVVTPEKIKKLGIITGGGNIGKLGMNLIPLVAMNGKTFKIEKYEIDSYGGTYKVKGNLGHNWFPEFMIEPIKDDQEPAKKDETKDQYVKYSDIKKGLKVEITEGKFKGKIAVVDSGKEEELAGNELVLVLKDPETGEKIEDHYGYEDLKLHKEEAKKDTPLLKKLTPEELKGAVGGDGKKIVVGDTVQLKFPYEFRKSPGGDAHRTGGEFDISKISSHYKQFDKEHGVVKNIIINKNANQQGYSALLTVVFASQTIEGYAVRFALVGKQQEFNIGDFVEVGDNIKEMVKKGDSHSSMLESSMNIHKIKFDTPYKVSNIKTSPTSSIVMISIINDEGSPTILGKDWFKKTSEKKDKLDEAIDQVFTESGLTGYEYELPEDKEKMLYDFYMSTLLNGRVKNQGPVSDLDLHNLEFTVNHTRFKLYTALQKELLNAVFFSLSAELRHFLDNDTHQHAKEILSKPEWEVYKKYLEKSAAANRYDLDPIRKVRSGFKGSQESYIDSFKAAKAADPKKETMVGAMEKLYREGHWAASYGGPAWAQIAKAWTKLNNVHVSDVDDTKGLNELMVWIDHVYDLQHNTDTVFNKIKSYAKESGYSWLKKALDYKRDIKNPYGMFDKITHSMKRLASFTFKAKENTSLEQYLKDNNKWFSSRKVDDTTPHSSTTQNTSDAKFKKGDVVKIDVDNTSIKEIIGYGIPTEEAKYIYKYSSVNAPIRDIKKHAGVWVYQVNFPGAGYWWFKPEMLKLVDEGVEKKIKRAGVEDKRIGEIEGSVVGDKVITNDRFSSDPNKIGLIGTITNTEKGETIRSSDEIIYVKWDNLPARAGIVARGGWFAYKFDKIGESSSKPEKKSETVHKYKVLSDEEVKYACDQNGEKLSVGDSVKIVQPNHYSTVDVDPKTGTEFIDSVIHGAYSSHKGEIGKVKLIVPHGDPDSKVYGYSALVTIHYPMTGESLATFAIRLEKVDNAEEPKKEPEKKINTKNSVKAKFKPGAKVKYIGFQEKYKNKVGTVVEVTSSTNVNVKFKDVVGFNEKGILPQNLELIDESKAPRFKKGDVLKAKPELTKEILDKEMHITSPHTADSIINGAVTVYGESAHPDEGDIKIQLHSGITYNVFSKYFDLDEKDSSTKDLQEDLNDPTKNWKNWKNPPFKDAANSGRKLAEKAIKRWNNLATGKTKDPNFTSKNKEPMTQLESFVEYYGDLDESIVTKYEITKGPRSSPGMINKQKKSNVVGRRVDRGSQGAISERRMTMKEQFRRKNKAAKGNLKASMTGKLKIGKHKKITHAKLNPFKKKKKS